MVHHARKRVGRRTTGASAIVVGPAPAGAGSVTGTQNRRDHARCLRNAIGRAGGDFEPGEGSGEEFTIHRLRRFRRGKTTYGKELKCRRTSPRAIRGLMQLSVPLWKFTGSLVVGFLSPYTRKLWQLSS